MLLIVILSSNFLGLKIALFSIFSSWNIRSRLINKVSSYSLLIYIIYYNYFIKKYYKGMYWEYIYQTYFYENLVIFVIFLAVVVFITSACLAHVFSVIKNKIENTYFVKQIIIILTENGRKLYDIIYKTMG